MNIPLPGFLIGSFYHVDPVPGGLRVALRLRGWIEVLVGLLRVVLPLALLGLIAWGTREPLAYVICAALGLLFCSWTVPLLRHPWSFRVVLEDGVVRVGGHELRREDVAFLGVLARPFTLGHTYYGLTVLRRGQPPLLLARDSGPLVLSLIAWEMRGALGFAAPETSAEEVQTLEGYTMRTRDGQFEVLLTDDHLEMVLRKGLFQPALSFLWLLGIGSGIGWGLLTGRPQVALLFVIHPFLLVPSIYAIAVLVRFPFDRKLTIGADRSVCIETGLAVLSPKVEAFTAADFEVRATGTGDGLAVYARLPHGRGERQLCGTRGSAGVQRLARSLEALTGDEVHGNTVPPVASLRTDLDFGDRVARLSLRLSEEGPRLRCRMTGRALYDSAREVACGVLPCLALPWLVPLAVGLVLAGLRSRWLLPRWCWALDCEDDALVLRRGQQRVRLPRGQGARLELDYLRFYQGARLVVRDGRRRFPIALAERDAILELIERALRPWTVVE